MKGYRLCIAFMVLIASMAISQVSRATLPTSTVSINKSSVTVGGTYIVSWTPSSGHTRYVVRYSNYSNMASYSWDIVSASTTSKTYTALSAQTLYYQIIADNTNTGESSGFSNIVSITINEPTCTDACSSGEIGCNTAKTQRYTCYDTDEDGCLEKSYTSCSAGYYCSSGSCVACSNECSSGQTGCNGSTQSWSCTQNSNGCWIKSYTNCSAGYYCSSNSCIVQPVTAPTVSVSSSSVANGQSYTVSISGGSNATRNLWQEATNSGFSGAYSYYLPTTTTSQSYSHNDSVTTIYYYRVIADNENTGTSAYSNTATVTVTVCTPNWTCGPWSACNAGTWTRTCTDANSCGTTSGMPATSGTCTMPDTAPVLNGNYFDQLSLILTFKITDADGDLPSLVYFFLYDANLNLINYYTVTQSVGTNPVSGIWYSYTFSSLADGTYNYYVVVDSRGTTHFYPGSGYSQFTKTTCTNECASGSSGCNSTSQRWTCGDNNDGDICLDRVPTNCSFGYQCSSGSCVCVPNWQCTAWAGCNGYFESRTCTDYNNCGTTSGKPAESQTCSIPCQVFSVDWSTWSAYDGDNVDFIIDNNGWCAGKSIEIWIYSDSLLLPDVYGSFISSSITNNYGVQSGWIVSYTDNIYFGVPHYYFNAVVDDQVYESLHELEVYPPRELPPPESMVEFLGEHPLVLDDECPDFGMVTMTYKCIQERQNAHQSFNIEELGEKSLDALFWVWAGSGVWCIAGNGIAYVGGASCPVTAGATCAGIPLYYWAGITGMGACGFFFGDAGVMIESGRIATQAVRTQAILNTLKEVEAVRTAEQAIILTSEATEAGGMLRTLKNGGITQDTVYFKPGTASTPYSSTFVNWIGEIEGGNLLLQYSKTKVALTNIESLTLVEKTSLATSFKNNVFQNIVEPYIAKSSKNQLVLADVLTEIQFLSGEQTSGALYDAKLIQMQTGFQSVIFNCPVTITWESAIGANIQHEITHLVIDAFLVKRGAVLGTVEANSANYYVLEYFTENFALGVLEGEAQATQRAYLQGYLRALSSHLGDDYYTLLNAYKDKNPWPLRAMYNLVKLSRDSELLARFDQDLLKDLGQNAYNSFIKEASVMESEAITFANEIPKFGSLGTKLNNLLVKYQLIEGKIIQTADSSSGSETGSGILNCNLSIQNPTTFLLNDIWILLPISLVYFLRRKLRKKHSDNE